mgnify:CR=1 FL=1
MNKFSLSSLFLMLLALASCKPQTPATPQSSFTDWPTEGYERVFIQRELTHLQPMTGLVLWPSHSRLNEYKESITLEYGYYLPCDVVLGKEDGQIQYDWSGFDQKLDQIALRGHQAVVRFRYEYPSNRDVDGERGTTAVPQYIKDLPDYHETYSEDPGGDGPTWYADWSNEELMWFTKQFYVDWAARYDSDPRIAFLEVGFGHWSEYHIYGTPLELGVNFPTFAYQAEFLTHLSHTLTMPWAISIDAADDNYTPIAHTDSLKALPFGLFDDSFMHASHEGGYNENNWRTLTRRGSEERWRTCPCGGEVSYYTSKDQREFLNPAGLYGHTWEEQAAKYHITFMMANDAPGGSYGTPARFYEAGLASGYRYCVLDAQTCDKETQLLVTNIGVAPIFYDAYFAIGDKLASLSLRTICPNDTVVVVVPTTCTNTADLHIVCDHILPSQTIEFVADIK